VVRQCWGDEGEGGMGGTAGEGGLAPMAACNGG
jgi:hypothetical protein